MGLDDGNKAAPKTLRGDASVKINSNEAPTTAKPKAKKLEVVNEKKSSVTTPVAQPQRSVAPTAVVKASVQDEDDTTIATTTTASSSVSTARTSKVVLELSPAKAPGFTNTTPRVASSESSNTVAAATVQGRYIPPHLRKKMMEEQRQQQ